jgi:hypothetical protein
MPFFLLLIAAVIFLAAVRDTHTQLGSMLAADVPGFLKWALAIVAIGALGMVPALKEVSRYLLALVFIVLVVTRYKDLFAGFTSLDTATAPAVTPPTSPADRYSSDAGGGGSLPDQPQMQLGTNTAASSAAGFDPEAYLSNAESQLNLASGFGAFLGA